MLAIKISLLDDVVLLGKKEPSVDDDIEYNNIKWILFNIHTTPVTCSADVIIL